MAQITLKKMAQFEALDRFNSVSGAARHLSISETAFVKKLDEMQADFEAPLFHRRGDEVVFTTAGRDLAARMRQVLRQAHEIEQFAARAQPTLTGRFRLGVIPTIAPYVLPGLLPKLRDTYPQLNLEIRETRTQMLLDEVTVGSVDAVLMALPCDLPDLEVRPLFDDALVLARRRGTSGGVPLVSLGGDAVEPNGLDPRAVDPKGLILLEDGHCLRDHALMHCAVSPNERLQGLGATSLPTVIQLVSNGLGETLLPEMALKVEASNPDLEIVRFREPAPSRQIGLVYRGASARAQDVDAIAQAIQDVRLDEVGSEAAE